LKKEFKYVPPPSAADEKPDADGITPSMLDFAWDRDVVSSVRSHLHVQGLFTKEVAGDKDSLEGSEKGPDEVVSTQD
jgi:hypothetical protein